MAERPARLLTDIKFVTIHHTATGLAQNINDLKSQANAIERYHKDKAIANSWSAKTDGEYGYYWIEYHYLIAQDGSFLQVQDTKWMRIHAGDWSKGKDSHNQHGVAICFVGNFEKDTPSEASLKTAGWLINRLEKAIKKEVYVKGHREVSLVATACPGKNLFAKIQNIKDYANSDVEPVIPPSDCDEIKKKNAELEKANQTMRTNIQEINAELSATKSYKEEAERLAKMKDELLVKAEEKEKEKKKLNDKLTAVLRDNTLKTSKIKELTMQVGNLSTLVAKLEKEASRPDTQQLQGYLVRIKKLQDENAELRNGWSVKQLLNELMKRIFNR